MFSSVGLSALYPLRVARATTCLTVLAQAGDALAREAGVIEPLVLPHVYSHIRVAVGAGVRERYLAGRMELVPLATIVRDVILLSQRTP